METEEFYAWEKVITKEEPLTWELWASPIKRSRCLTPLGRNFILEMVKILSDFLGKDFLNKCVGTDHPLLSLHYSPANDVQSVYYHLILISSRIQMALAKSFKGIRQLRKDVRSNTRASAWHHAQMQLELAGLAFRGGQICELEPFLPSCKKADLRVQGSNGEMVFETVSMGTDHNSRKSSDVFNAINDLVTNISLQHNLRIEGSIKEIPELPEVMHGFLQQISNAANEVLTSGKEVTVRSIIGYMIISESQEFVPALIQGPPTYGNEWGRLEARIKEKANQTKGASSVWIRLDSHSGLWYFTEWAQKPLEERLINIATLIKEALQEYEHINGMIISNSWGWDVNNESEDKTYIINEDIAIKRYFRDGRMRETLIIGRNASKTDQLNEIATWYKEEPSWLEWALNNMKYPSLNELFVSDVGV